MGQRPPRQAVDQVEVQADLLRVGLAAFLCHLAPPMHFCDLAQEVTFTAFCHAQNR